MLLHVFLHNLIHHLLVGLMLLVAADQLDPAPSSGRLHQLLLLCGGEQRAGRGFWVGVRE